MAHRGARDLSVRVAAYYAPAPDDPLWRAGCTWLGWDPELGTTVPQPALPGIAALTRDAATYGFHATLKPPMRLSTSYVAFMDDARDLAAGSAAFDLPPLAVSNVAGFLALRETVDCPQLQSLADACVRGLDAHRTPPGEAELARRRAGGRLSQRQDELLIRWGYPYVLDTWFFHMTLTRRLSPDEAAEVWPAAQQDFAEALARPRRVDALSIFTQAAPDAPFLLAERLAFGR